MKQLENEVIHYHFFEGILIGHYKVESLNISDAKNAVQLRQLFIDGKSFPTLIKGTNLTSIDKKARDYFASDAAIIGVTASAMIVNSIVQATLINFFLHINPPKMPTKVFTDEKKALKWLEQFV